MSVAQFAEAGMMTEAEYEAERRRIRDTYGDSKEEAEGSLDQTLARLFARSRWSQERLAAKEGKSQSWIDYRQRFGRFLNITTTVVIPKSLTERRFRDYWKRTESIGPNEHKRFPAIQQLMAEELTLSKPHTTHPKIAAAILEHFADTESWHRLATIVETVEAPEEDVVAVLTSMEQKGTYQTHCEKRKGGTSWSYKLVRGSGLVVDVDHLVKLVSPIIRALKAEGRKHPAQSSPGTIAELAEKLKTILEDLTHQALPASKKARPPQKGQTDAVVSTEEI
jgi:hypothetical protein